MGSIPILNQVVNQYSDRLLVFSVYTVEAHPASPDLSPYSGTVWSTPGTNGQYYNQPITYGERKSIVEDMISTESILTPILLDGPCNEWWMYYTNYPNNAILIDSTGVIFAIHKEFDDFYENSQPADIFCDIDSLLGYPTGCSGAGTSGVFTYIANGSPSATGSVGTIITLHATLTNSSNEGVFINVIRKLNNIPTGWTTQMCTGQICLDPFTDSTLVYLDPGDSSEFNLYFNTDALPDTGVVRMLFENQNNPQNNKVQNFRGITVDYSGIPEIETNECLIYPNPFSKTTSFLLPDDSWLLSEAVITDINGRVVFTCLLNSVEYKFINDNLLPGIYYLTIYNIDRRLFKKLIIL